MQSRQWKSRKIYLIFLCALCGNHEHMSVLQINTESEHRCGMEWSWPARLQFRVHLQKRGVSLRPLQVVAIPVSGPPPASKLFRQIHFLAIIFTAHTQMLSPPQNYVLCNHDALRGFETGSILDDHPLNTSDYLPVCCKINVSHVRAPPRKHSHQVLLIGKMPEVRGYVPSTHLKQTTLSDLS